MNVDKFDFKAHSFHLLRDEAMRQNACQAVDLFLKDNVPVKNAQLRSIPIVIQAKGLSGLRNLIENQKNKTTKKDNSAFWKFIWELILAYPGPQFSLRYFLQNQPQIMVLLKDETSPPGKIEQKQARKANKAAIDQIMENVLPIYFEHFNCHYFYRTRQGA
jgi:hypothetical protein